MDTGEVLTHLVETLQPLASGTARHPDPPLLANNRGPSLGPEAAESAASVSTQVLLYSAAEELATFIQVHPQGTVKLRR